MNIKHIILSVLSAILTISACSKEDAGPEEFRGKIDTQESVDLGLSVIWSGYNLCAAGAEKAGAYYAWGDNAEKESYLSDNYTAPAADIWENDPATALWGGTWRIPTPDELAELCDTLKCSVRFAKFKGKNGWVVTSKISGYEGTSIFFPAAGYKAGDHVNYAGEQGVYWSSRLTAAGSTHAANLFFDGNKALMNIPPKGVGGTLWCGYPLRPVRNR